jgi:hypothetical protein
MGMRVADSFEFGDQVLRVFTSIACRKRESFVPIGRHCPARPQRLVLINVTVARQITEAFRWDEASHHLIRDRDRIYGRVVVRRLRTMGIRDKPTASASP